MAQPQIDPRVLQALMSGQDIGQYGYMTSQYQPGQWEGGDGGSFVNSGPAQTHLIQGIDKNSANVFDSQGNYLGLNSGASDGQALTNFVLTALAMYAGGQALGGGAGAGGAGAGGAGAGAGGAGVGAGAGAGGSITGLTSAEIAASNAAATSGLAGNVAALAPVNLGTAGAMAGGAVGAAGAAGGTGGVAQAGTGTLGSLMGLDYSTWAKLAGGVIGALTSGDQEQTSTQNKEPWGPAQQWIKDNIASGQALQKQYQAQPLSQAQQGAYGNMFGLLNSMNANSPAMYAGMNANSSGANNYDRNNPRRQLTGSTVQAPTFGLLNPDFTRFGG